MADVKKEGKVVRILSKHEIVVNLGLTDGVLNHHEFLVYRPGDELRDPDTGESLGTLEIVKGRGMPKHIQERLTTLRSSETRTTRTHESSVFKLAGLSRDVQTEVPFSDVEIGDLVRPL
ncbi:MAG TPA: hypothetical protein VGP64_00765 [Polyangia bacterium]|jgi:hypothetical protein